MGHRLNGSVHAIETPLCELGASSWAAMLSSAYVAGSHVMRARRDQGSGMLELSLAGRSEFQGLVLEWMLMAKSDQKIIDEESARASEALRRVAEAERTYAEVERVEAETVRQAAEEGRRDPETVRRWDGDIAEMRERIEALERLVAQIRGQRIV